MDTLAADPAAPTDLETAQAREAAREEYLAVLLIRLSDPKRYLTLIVDLQNNHTHGTDQYPNTIAKAYDMLVHCRNPSRQPRMDHQDMGMSFYNEDDDDDRALTEFRQLLQVQIHLEVPRILVQLGHIQRT